MKNILLLSGLLAVTRVVSAQQMDSTRVKTTTTETTITTLPRQDTAAVRQSTPSVSYAGSYDGGSVRLGIRFAPGLAFNSVESESISNEITNNGSGVRLSGGLTADFMLTDNYAFSTGLWYTIRRSAFNRVRFPESNDPMTSPTVIGSSEYNLQYLQIPVTLKLFTNEVAPDARLYFQLGGTFDAKLAERAIDKSLNALYARSVNQSKKIYKPVDVSLLLGLGTEFRMGENTTFFGGLTYNRGLLNAVRGLEYNGQDLNDNMKTLNSTLSLEIGLKF
ncbi:MAG: PorT family protein [Ferruginibacter sp.]|nr:PorT family protein [Cytophagales bacterium]